MADLEGPITAGLRTGSRNRISAAPPTIDGGQRASVFEEHRWLMVYLHVPEAMPR